MSNPDQFKRSEDRHCVFEECRECGEVLTFSNLRATSASIESAKAAHVCAVAAAA
jgi:hypothetical protein